MGGHPRIVVGLLSHPVEDDPFGPIELKGIRITGQRDAVGPASDRGMMRATVPHLRPFLVKVLFSHHRG